MFITASSKSTPAVAAPWPWSRIASASPMSFATSTPSSSRMMSRGLGNTGSGLLNSCMPSMHMGPRSAWSTLMSTAKRGWTCTTDCTSGRSRRMQECIFTSLGTFSSFGPSVLKPSRSQTSRSSSSSMESAGPSPLMTKRSGCPGSRMLACPRSMVRPSARPVSYSIRLASTTSCLTSSSSDMTPSFVLLAPWRATAPAAASYASPSRPGTRAPRGAPARRRRRARRSGRRAAGRRPRSRRGPRPPASA